MESVIYLPTESAMDLDDCYGLKSETFSIKWYLVKQVLKFKPNRKNVCQLCVSGKARPISKP